MNISLARHAFWLAIALTLAAMALTACQPRTPDDTPRPMLSGRQAPGGGS